MTLVALSNSIILWFHEPVLLLILQCNSPTQQYVQRCIYKGEICIFESKQTRVSYIRRISCLKVCILGTTGYKNVHILIVYETAGKLSWGFLKRKIQWCANKANGKMWNRKKLKLTDYLAMSTSQRFALYIYFHCISYLAFLLRSSEKCTWFSPCPPPGEHLLCPHQVLGSIPKDISR